MGVVVDSISPQGVVTLRAEGDLKGADLGVSGDRIIGNLVGRQWPCHRVVLDMHEASYMDSAALGWLIQVHKEFSAGGGKLVVCSVPPAINRLFSLMSLDKVISIEKDQASALDAVQGAAS
ncbi:MAG: STAS domain-containing protein [Rhodospirillales bacterium]|nr:STAS domain-containing protein [Rhodospirillales bacterium]